MRTTLEVFVKYWYNEALRGAHHGKPFNNRIEHGNGSTERVVVANWTALKIYSIPVILLDLQDSCDGAYLSVSFVSFQHIPMSYAAETRLFQRRIKYSSRCSVAAISVWLLF